MNTKSVSFSRLSFRTFQFFVLSSVLNFSLLFSMQPDDELSRKRGGIEVPMDLGREKKFCSPTRLAAVVRGNGSEEEFSQMMDQLIKDGHQQEPLDQRLLALLERTAPEEVKDVITVLSDPTIMKGWPAAVVLEGPPGTGKSTLMKFIAQKVGWPYYFVPAVSLANQYQHSGAKNVSLLISKLLEIAARQRIFLLFDEVNSLTDKGDKNRQVDQGTVEAFWIAIDRIKKNKKLVILATTNDLKKHRKQMKSRLLRTTISVPLLQDPKTIDEILKFHLFDACPLYKINDAARKKIVDKMGELPARDIETIVESSLCLAKIRNPKVSVVITPPDIYKALSGLRATDKKYEKTFFKKLIKFCNKKALPLLGTANGLLGIVNGGMSLVSTPLSLYISLQQLLLGNKNFNLGEDSLKVAKDNLLVGRKSFLLNAIQATFNRETARKNDVRAGEQLNATERSIQVAKDGSWIPRYLKKGLIDFPVWTVKEARIDKQALAEMSSLKILMVSPYRFRNWVLDLTLGKEVSKQVQSIADFPLSVLGIAVEEGGQEMPVEKLLSPETLVDKK